MITTASHCTVCHMDIPVNNYHSCGGNPTPCGPKCHQKLVLGNGMVAEVIGHAECPYCMGTGKLPRIELRGEVGTMQWKDGIGTWSKTQ